VVHEDLQGRLAGDRKTKGPAVTETQPTKNEYTIKPLGPDTWDAFADLAERHNGVWGGCWCTWFHTMHAEKTFSADDNRALKQRLVKEGRAHAALVFDGDVAVAWCRPRQARRSAM
jgi:hypothetical protein